ncbi:MAG: hypothetical protein HY520_00720 [Candidatus Aenigmarchaeota archaeon]|nr:hypothetical protein [Candidatus Aenigmarchaeota archaeon]
MKGFVETFIFVIGVFLLTFFLPLVELKVFGGGGDEFAHLTRDTYSLANAVEYGKLVADQSFSYAYYQGCWDVLQTGGYSEVPEERREGNLALWYDNSGYPPPHAIDELGKVVGTHLNRYMGGGFTYLQNRLVRPPTTYQVTFSQTAQGLRGSADSADAILVERAVPSRGEHALLLGDSRLMRTFPMHCIDLLEGEWRLGRGVGTQVKRLVVQEANAWPKQGTAVLRGPAVALFQPDAREMGNQVLGLQGKSLAQAEEEISGKIRAGMEGIALEDAPPYDRALAVVEASATIEPACSGTSGFDGEEQVITLECQFTYQIKAVARVTVTDSREETKVPVFNGQAVAYSPLQLAFGVRVDLALDEQVDIPELEGRYVVTVAAGEESSFFLDLQQDGEVVAWATGLQGGIVRGQGSLAGGLLALEGVPALLLVEGNQEVVLLDLVGEVDAAGVAGEFQGTRARGEPLAGTFSAQPLAAAA